MKTRTLIRIACALYIGQAFAGIVCGIAWAAVHTGVL
jgi:hypothetical protein